MRIRALLVAIIAIVGGGCGDAEEGGAAGEEDEISNAVLRETGVANVQVASCTAVQREIVIAEDTDAVEVTVPVEGDSIDDCPAAGLHIDPVALLGDRRRTSTGPAEGGPRRIYRGRLRRPRSSSCAELPSPRHRR